MSKEKKYLLIKVGTDYIKYVHQIKVYYVAHAQHAKYANLACSIIRRKMHL